jgi:2-aminoethylphosphonate-pyruvate transaminase
LWNVAETLVCVPVQGSGTFAVEATIGSVVPPDGKLLILVNGAYGHTMAKICDYLGRAYVVIETPEDTPVDVVQADSLFAGDTSITHVAVIHCETTAGIINPLGRVSDLVARHGRSLLVDAMSSYGALELDGQQLVFDALMASFNKRLEAVSGLGYGIVRRSVLENCEGTAHPRDCVFASSPAWARGRGWGRRARRSLRCRFHCRFGTVLRRYRSAPASR